MSTPETSSDTPSTSTKNIPSVSLKLPPFWPSDPSIWFAQVEAQFQTRNITSKPTKYHHVISVLPPEIDVTSSSPLLSPLSATATPSVSTIDLQEQISQLTFAVQALQSQVSSRGRSPYRRSSYSSGSRRPSRSSSRSGHPNSECWYHWRFGVNARKCQSPCSLRSSSLGNGPTSD